jgi:hypothetical protein
MKPNDSTIGSEAIWADRIPGMCVRDQEEIETESHFNAFYSLYCFFAFIGVEIRLTTA